MVDPRELFQEYAKFVKKDVVVKYHEGDKVKSVKGNLRFLNFQYLSCVVMTKDEKVIIKNVITISRERTFNGDVVKKKGD